MTNSQLLIKKQLEQLFKQGKHIGVLINTENLIRKPLVQRGLNESEILNDLRYLKEKGFIRPYNKNLDDVEEITLTAQGQDWLENKAEPVRIESVKLRYNPWTIVIIGTIIATIVAGLVLYYFFGIK